MRQQEANQFDKGINLDTNPIAMDNHQLTGALNATMITMNGNELVLLNDMGNGRVDQAQLPEGYVPVGMLEYGGIVYVASYNPIKGESLIGCFPSPQRNFPSVENGNGSTNLLNLVSFISSDGFIKELSSKKLLIGGSDIVRTGDKFIITALESDIAYYETCKDYIKLRVVVVDDDGSSVDITDDLTQVRNSVSVPFIKALTNLSDISGITENQYSIYKNKISGKIYLKAQLIIPSYINTQILASKVTGSYCIATSFSPNTTYYIYFNNLYVLVLNPTQQIFDSRTADWYVLGNSVTITITPTSYAEPDGETEVVWDMRKTIDNAPNPNYKNVHSYTLNYRINGGNLRTCTLSNKKFTINNLAEDATLWYELYPTYTYEGVVGKVESLKRENTIEIGDIGTGEVRFSTFRYYNNMASETFSFDYGLNAYIEGFDGNNHTLNSVYIEAFDVDDIFVVTGDNSLNTNTYNDRTFVTAHLKKIQLGTSNYFGVYTKMISYGAETLEIGKHYIARLCAIVDKTDNNPGVLTKGKWYSIITSTVTNKLYVQNSANMIKIQTDDHPLDVDFERHVFEFSWESEFDREVIDENSNDLITPDSVINNVLTSAPPSVDTRISYQTYKTGDIKYNHTCSTKIPQSRDINDAAGGRVKFPYSMTMNPALHFSDFKANAEIIRNGELSDATVNGFQNEDIPNIRPSGDGNKIYYTLDVNTVKFNYTLYSQFFLKLLKNSDSNSNTIEDYKFTINTEMSAFVPYLPAFRTGYEADEQLMKILGPLYKSDSESNPALGCSPIYTNIETTYWLYYALGKVDWHGNGGQTKDYAKHYVGIVNGGGFAHLESGIDYIVNESYMKKSDHVKWSTLSPQIADRLRSKFGYAPAIVMWCGADDEQSSLYPQEGPSRGNNSANNSKQTWYGIVLMLDETGSYHVLNQYGRNYQGPFLLDIVKTFANVYVCLPNQLVDIDYWTGDPNNYVYTKNYQLNTIYKAYITVNSGAMPTITNNRAYALYNRRTGGNETITFDGVQIQLPKIQIEPGSREQQYTDVFSSPDQSVKNSEFLLASSSPTFGTCAIILDKAGKHVIMNAYRHHTANENVPVPFNPNHVYVKSNNSFDSEIGMSTKLYDVYDMLNILPEVWASSDYWTTGTGWVAQALREGKLKVATNPDNDAKILAIVPGRCTRLKRNNLGTNCVWWLGYSFNHSSSSNARTSRVELVNLCDLFVDVDLITGNTNNGSDGKIRKLSAPYTTSTYNS